MSDEQDKELEQLENKANVQEQAEQQTEEFNGATDTPDAPVAQQQPSEPPNIKLTRAVGMGVGTGFAIVAARRGEHWMLSPEENEELSKSIVEVLDHYMPELGKIDHPLVGLVLAAGGVVGTRLMIDQANAAKDVTPDVDPDGAPSMENMDAQLRAVQEQTNGS